MPYVERMSGTPRRELVDHTIVTHERHLRRLLRSYVSEYDRRCRTHGSLGKDVPELRPVEPPEKGPAVELPLAGLEPLDPPPSAPAKRAYPAHAGGSDITRPIARCPGNPVRRSPGASLGCGIPG